MLKHFYNIIVAEWRDLDIKEKLLLLGVLLYGLLVGIYFYCHWSVLKYGSLLLGIMFAACVTEVAREKRLGFKVGLLLLLAIGAAGMELIKDQEDGRYQSGLKGQIEALHLTKHRKNELWNLERSIDLNKVSPRDTASKLEGSGQGFLIKAERLSLRVALLESRLLTNAPTLAPQLLKFPSEPAKKLAAYEALKKSQVISNIEIQFSLGELEKTLSEEEGYRKLSQYFIREIAPQYRVLNGESQGQDVDKVGRKLGEIEMQLSEQLTNYPLAGLYNHLGILAMGRFEVNRALAYFYTGITLDPEHLPLYESISYAEWILDHASWSAQNYANIGIVLCTNFPSELDSEFKETSSNYNWLLSSFPGLKPELLEKQGTLKLIYNSAFTNAVSFADSLCAKLQLTYAYNSALDLQNEKIARIYAKRLYDSDPKDPEYEDTLGFVLMQFGTNNDELLEADKLFGDAERNGEEMTKALVAVHIRQLKQLQQEESGNEQVSQKP